MRHLDWTSQETLEGEKLAYFVVIPLAVFVCTFWLLMVDQPILFAVGMLVSIVATVLIVRNHSGTRIIIDDKKFRFGAFQRISLKNISSVAIEPTIIGSNDILVIGTRGDEESETFNMSGVPEEIRAQILELLRHRLDSV